MFQSNAVGCSGPMNVQFSDRSICCCQNWVSRYGKASQSINDVNHMAYTHKKLTQKYPGGPDIRYIRSLKNMKQNYSPSILGLFIHKFIIYFVRSRLTT